MENQDDFLEIDIENHVKNGTEIPKNANSYLIRIDKEKFKWKRVFITGREILELAGKSPVEKFQVNQKFRFGRVEKVELDEKVDLIGCEVERFVIIPLDQTEGRPVRAFSLPAEDTEYLDSMGYEWETIRENIDWLIIRNFPIPEGFNSDKADIAIMLPGYPISPLDMVYVYPHLHLKSGNGIGALTPYTLESKAYQRWSRHRTANNPWIPGVDNISTHVELIRNWFKREISK
jgi:hypothetical protein